jgi:hypothetical protein
MTELQAEERFTLGAVGPKVIKDVIKHIINTMIEREVIGNIVLIFENVSLELFDLLQPKERHYYSILANIPFR